MREIFMSLNTPPHPCPVHSASCSLSQGEKGIPATLWSPAACLQPRTVAWGPDTPSRQQDPLSTHSRVIRPASCFLQRRSWWTPGPAHLWWPQTSSPPLPIGRPWAAWEGGRLGSQLGLGSKPASATLPCEQESLPAVREPINCRAPEGWGRRG